MKVLFAPLTIALVCLVLSACALDDSMLDPPVGSQLELRERGDVPYSTEVASTIDWTLEMSESRHVATTWVAAAPQPGSQVEQPTEDVDPEVIEETRETPTQPDDEPPEEPTDEPTDEPADEPTDDPVDAPFVSSDWDDYTVSIPYAVLQGQMVRAQDIDSEAYRSSVWGWGEGLDSSIYWNAEPGVAMLLFDFHGELDVIRAGGEMDRWGDASGSWLAITGCSGPREGDWLFDGPPDDVVLHYTSATDDPNYLILSFTATFGVSVIDGKIEVLLTPRS